MTLQRAIDYLATQGTGVFEYKKSRADTIARLLAMRRARPTSRDALSFGKAVPDGFGMITANAKSFLELCELNLCVVTMTAAPQDTHSAANNDGIKDSPRMARAPRDIQVLAKRLRGKAIRNSVAIHTELKVKMSSVAGATITKNPCDLRAVR